MTWRAIWALTIMSRKCEGVPCTTEQRSETSLPLVQLADEALKLGKFRLCQTAIAPLRASAKAEFFAEHVPSPWKDPPLAGATERARQVLESSKLRETRLTKPADGRASSLRP